MTNGFDKPQAGAFGARLLSRFLDGLTTKYQRGQEQKREDELLAGRREEERARIGEKRKYERGLLDEELFREGREKKELKTRQDELLDRAKLEAEEAATVAHERKMAWKELDNAIKGVGKPPKPPKPKTEPQEMRDFATVYGDILDKGDIRGIVKEKMKFGLSDTQAIGRFKGRDLAWGVLDEMQDNFFQWGKKPTDKFINGNDLLTVLAPHGFGGEIVGLDPSRDYSAEEAIILITSAQEDPIAFAKSSEAMKNIIEVIYDLLEQTYDPGEGEDLKTPKETVGVGKAFTRGFGKLTRPGTIPRLP